MSLDSPGASQTLTGGTVSEKRPAARLRLPFISWQTAFVLLGWFGAEIATGTTDWSHALDLDKAIFSFSYYLVQLAIVADLISRYRLEPRRIFVLGLVFGLAEEAFYVKNPLPLALLLSVGHATVTVLFPYTIVRLLTTSERLPSLNRWWYALLGAYLAFLYVVSLRHIPITSLDTIFAGVIWVGMVVAFVRLVRAGPAQLAPGKGISWMELAAISVVTVLVSVASHQTYFGVVMLAAWFLVRQNRFTARTLMIACLLYLVIHYGLATLRPDYPANLVESNYPTALLLAAILASWMLIRLRRTRGDAPAQWSE